MADIKQNADGSLSVFSPQSGKALFTVGGPAAPTGSNYAYRAENYLKFAIGTSVATAGLLSIASPFPEDVIIDRAIIHTVTGQSLTLNMSLGVVSNSSAFGNNLLDSLTAAITAGTYDNITNKGTSGGSARVWGTTQYITLSGYGGSVNTFVGNLYLGVVRP